MDKASVLAKAGELGVISVLRGPNPELTLKMVDALVAGGVLAIEITYSTPNAEDVVRAIDAKYGDKIPSRRRRRRLPARSSS